MRLIKSIPEALCGSKLCNAWNISAVEMLMLDRVSLLTGKLIDEGRSCEEWMNTEWKN